MCTQLIVVQMVRQRRYYGYNRYSGRGLGGFSGVLIIPLVLWFPGPIRQN